MLFGWWKKRKLAEEAKKREEQRIQEEAIQNKLQTQAAFDDNVQIFFNICHMVGSLPKKRHIVVVQRENVFVSDSDRNRAYLKLARRLQYRHHSSGQKWMSAFGKNDDALYAFYEPKRFTVDFRLALEKFSEGGYRIQRIRYYSQNL